jgi:hypothetical protein
VSALREGPTAPRRSRTNTVFLIAAGVVLVICVAVGYLMVEGLDLVCEQVRADISDNPVVLEHIGEIESIGFEFWASGMAKGDDTFVFALKGTKGEGVLTAEVITIDADHEEVLSGTLRLPSGEKMDLFPERDGGR